MSAFRLPVGFTVTDVSLTWTLRTEWLVSMGGPVLMASPKHEQS